MYPVVGLYPGDLLCVSRSKIYPGDILMYPGVGLYLGDLVHIFRRRIVSWLSSSCIQK